MFHVCETLRAHTNRNRQTQPIPFPHVYLRNAFHAKNEDEDQDRQGAPNDEQGRRRHVDLLLELEQLRTKGQGRVLFHLVIHLLEDIVLEQHELLHGRQAVVAPGTAAGTAAAAASGFGPSH